VKDCWKDEAEVEVEADGKAAVEGSWKDGGVASGRVVNRIPADTPALFSFALR